MKTTLNAFSFEWEVIFRSETRFYKKMSVLNLKLLRIDAMKTWKSPTKFAVKAGIFLAKRQLEHEYHKKKQISNN